MRHLSRALLALLAIVSLAGCKGGDVVGTWEASISGQPITATFNPDGSLIMVGDIPEIGVQMKFIGAFEQNGNYMTVGFSDIKLENLPPELEPQRERIIEKMKSKLPMNTPHRGPMEWKDKDTFIAQATNDSVTFKRKK